MASNWSDLPHDLITLIMSKLFLIQDYVRFGNTCVRWHSFFIENRHQLPRQFPVLMFPFKHNEDHEPQKSSFYCLLEKRVYDFKSLVVPHKGRCLGSSFGWLITVDKRATIRLLNPFLSTNNEIHLPSLNTLEPIYRGNRVLTANDVQKVVLTANPASTHDYLVIVIYKRYSKLGFIKAGDKNWTLVGEDQYEAFKDVKCYKDKLYVLCFGKLKAFDISSHHPKSIEHIAIEHVAQLPFFYWPGSNQLVESSGELLLIIREFINCTDYFEYGGDYWPAAPAEFVVLKLDPIERKWKMLDSLGGCSLFLGDNSSISLSASDFPGCKPNCIYFTYYKKQSTLPRPLYGPNDIGVFNVENHSFETEFPTKFSMIMPQPIWVEPSLQGCYG